MRWQWRGQNAGDRHAHLSQVARGTRLHIRVRDLTAITSRCVALQGIRDDFDIRALVDQYLAAFLFPISVAHAGGIIVPTLLPNGIHWQGWRVVIGMIIFVTGSSLEGPWIIQFFPRQSALTG
jgi:hypothetical protein